jgi:hypothetical protein
MFKATVKNLSNEITNEASFSTMGELNSWLEKEIANESFGKAAYDEIVRDEADPGIIIETINHAAEYTVEIEDITLVTEKRESLEDKRLKGANARKACIDALDVIAGYNLDRVLSAEQITQMQSTFGTIQSALMTNRPSSAKALITAITPDGVLVSEAMKEDILEVLKDY